MNKFQILHISDMHVKVDEDFDRSLVIDPLLERINSDIEKDIRPEIVIVTGDIAFKGLSAEYKIAKEFFDDLLQCLGLTNDRIFIVPGNHDVDRKKYRPGDIPVYNNMRALNDELKNDKYRKDLLKGMNGYLKFIHKNYPHLKSRHGNLIPFVYHYKTDCGKNIGLLGLNSAWMCRKSPDNGEIAIGEYQLKKAMSEIKESGEMDIKINCFHHPLDWLWAIDRSKCMHYFKNSILLNGHFHDVEGRHVNTLHSAFHQFQAGGIYLGSECDSPQRYHYITFDWKGNYIKLDFRKYAKEKRQWCLDGETGNDGQIIFKMMQSKVRRIKIAIEKPEFFPSNPFQTGGTLPANAKSYIRRECDFELERVLESNNKKLIVIHGENEIGKSSLLNRALHVPYLATGNWKKYNLDLQGLFPNIFENFMEFFFDDLSSTFGQSISSWLTLDSFLRDQPLVLCFDEFGIFSDYEKIGKHFIQNLCVLAQKSDNIRIISCLKIPIKDFFKTFPESCFRNPKYRRGWKNIAVKPFNESEIKQLLNLLPESFRKIALNEIRKIEEFSNFRPRNIQCLCYNFFEATTEKPDESKLINIINDENNYS